MDFIYNFDRLSHFSAFLFIEEFKCYSCHTNKKENCVKRERVCKQEEPICLEIIGVYGYVLQCSDMEYYNQATQDCEDFCEVEYCTESLCNDPDN